MPATKVKLSEFAADLNLSAQEVADQLKAMDDKVRKTTAALTDAEMNYLLEYYTQRNQVENFDAYFADRSEQAQPQPAKKPKRAAKPEQVARPKKQDAKPEAKQETAPKAKPAQPEKKQEETTARPQSRQSSLLRKLSSRRRLLRQRRPKPLRPLSPLHRLHRAS